MVPEGSLAERAAKLLRDHDVSARLISAAESSNLDRVSEVAVFEVDGLVLRFVRERTEEFLDIGTQVYSDEFHQYDDVAIALGWTSVDAVLDKKHPESLGAVVSQIARHLPNLHTELAGEHAEWTRRRIIKANADRAHALERRLR